MMLASAVRVFEQINCLFGLAICSLVLSHPLILKMGRIRFIGEVSPPEYLKSEALPLFQTAGFTLGADFAKMLLDKSMTSFASTMNDPLT